MIASAIGKIGRRVSVQQQAFVTLGLLVLVISMAAVVVGRDVADVNAFDLWLAMLISVFLVWLLIRTRLPDWAEVALGLVSGICLALLWTGQLIQPLVGFLDAGATAIWHTAIEWLRALNFTDGFDLSPGGLPDFTSLVDAWGVFAATAGPRLQGAFSWLIAQAQGNPTYNPIGAGIFWTALLWFLAGWAVWGIYRWRNAIAGLLPLTLLLASIVAFSQGDWLPLVVVLGAALFLVAWTQYHARLADWQNRGMGYSAETRFDLTSAAVVTITLIATLAFLAATLPVPKIPEWLRQVYQPGTEALQQAGEGLGILQSPGEAVSAGSGGLPRFHLISAGPELLQKEVLFIQTSDPLPAQVNDLSLQAYYWRGQAYDVYSGRGWQTSATDAENLANDQPATVTESPYNQEFNQQVHVLGSTGGQVFFMGEFEQVSQPATLEWRSTPAGEGVDLFAALTESPDYSVSSRRLVAGENILREAQGEIPEWILQRYLQLPADTPQRVLDLAYELTQAAETPYDRALALESYLRKFPYTLEVAAPPAGRDVADYFLFDLQKGYCDYYATAMAVMARAVGLPARLAVGYSAGSYDPARAGYLVRETNAHAWVEIYFDGVGWVTFEPTAGLPAIARLPFTAQPADELAASPALPPSGELPTWLGTVLLVTAIAIGIFLLCGLAWLAWERWRLSRIPPVSALMRMYAGICRAGRRLNVVHMAGDTPFEYSAALTQRLARLESGRSWIASIQPAREQMDELVALYSQAVYSSEPPRAERVGRAVKGWQGLRFKLLASWLASLGPGRESRRPSIDTENS